ncbi:MAG TPA: pilus assembly protein TadG-related protein [Isosphaeraceae bacterium]|nr:pilus assembly protein TadG-related protein [Isosphaeraceae bacterium]
MVMALVAVFMPVIIGVMALALDGGLLYLQRRQAQSVADAAALAGAYATYTGSNFTVARSAAIAIGAQNGYTISASQVTAPKTGYVAVSVTSSRPRFFSALWGAGTLSVTASAVARGSTGSFKGSVLLLGSTGTDLSASGNGSLNIVGGSLSNGTGSVIINSTSSSAASTNGNATLTAPAFSITGNYRGNLVGSITTGVSPTSDPLSSLTPPNPLSLTARAYTGQTTLQPGVYVGGISLSGNASVTLSPGIYYMQGGGLSLSGNATLAGSGVMIYNDSSGGSINLAGNGSVTLSPMTTGTYAGITIFQDRSTSTGITLAGNGTMNITGTLYAPAATLSMRGNGDSTVASQIIASAISLAGNGEVNVNYGAAQPQGLSFGLVQ